MVEPTVENIKDLVGNNEFDYNNFKGDFEGQEIIYVTGEGYKLAVDMGNYTYILDLPDNFLLGDISKIQVNMVML